MARLTDRIPGEQQTGEDTGYNWMDTYGDLVTLLLCFFVMLFAMSNIDQNKFEKIAGSFRDSRLSLLNGSESFLFSGENSVIDLEYSGDYEAVADTTDIADTVDTTDTTDAADADEAAAITGSDGRMAVAGSDGAAADQVSMNTLNEALESYIDGQGLSDTISVSIDRTGIKMIFADSLFFDSGNADLKSGSTRILLDIIPFFENFQGVFQAIKVEGHTDSRPISNRTYKNNWWLSNVRALNVAEFILENSAIDPSKISCEGRGEYQPIADNSTSEGMAKNRRVELVIAM